MGQSGDICHSGEIFSQKVIGVFISPSPAGAVRTGKEDRDTDLFVFGVFTATIQGEGNKAQFASSLFHRFGSKISCFFKFGKPYQTGHQFINGVDGMPVGIADGITFTVAVFRSQ